MMIPIISVMSCTKSILYRDARRIQYIKTILTISFIHALRPL